MPTKISFFAYYLLFEGKFAIFFKDKKFKKRSHKTGEIMVFLSF
jgi:hypothetical protein